MSYVTMHASAWLVRGATREWKPSLASLVSATLWRRPIALTCEVWGFARLNHGLTTMVTSC